jgi:hypothetical protein
LETRCCKSEKNTENFRIFAVLKKHVYERTHRGSRGKPYQRAEYYKNNDGRQQPPFFILHQKIKQFFKHMRIPLF